MCSGVSVAMAGVVWPRKIVEKGTFFVDNRDDGVVRLKIKIKRSRLGNKQQKRLFKSFTFLHSFFL